MKQPILVKLKMKGIYKSTLSVIGFLIVLISTIGILYLSYNKYVELTSDIEVNGELSINYSDGKKFNVETQKTINFSISNSSDKVSYYNIGFKNVQGNGTYKLLFNDILITEGELKNSDFLKDEYISIDAHETKIYTLELLNSGNENLKGTININVQVGKITTFADTILKNNPPLTDAITLVGEEISTDNEGLIKSSDDIGVSYYFRGNITNNYVSFGDKLWRIVRINGDGTVRLVLNGVADSVGNYYTNYDPNINYKNSNINKFLNDWISVNLQNEMNYIANTKFCSDITHDNSNNYLAYSRIMTNKIPTLNCLGTAFNSNIGTLTIDEVILAGANPVNNNLNYYLYNSEIKNVWYTMSGAKGDALGMNLFMIDVNGKVKYDVNGNLYRSIRPVINLVKNIEVIGDGTINNPYQIKM